MGVERLRAQGEGCGQQSLFLSAEDTGATLCRGVVIRAAQSLVSRTGKGT